MTQIIVIKDTKAYVKSELLDKASDASMAFMCHQIDNTVSLQPLTNSQVLLTDGDYSRWGYRLSLVFDQGTYDDWICSSHKRIYYDMSADQFNSLIESFKSLGLVEDKDFFTDKAKTYLGTRPLNEEDYDTVIKNCLGCSLPMYWSNTES